MGDRELRCSGNKLYGLVVDGEATGILEVRCTSRFCGKQDGVVVLHQFNLGTGEYQTRKYKEPRKGGLNGTRPVRTAVRSSGCEGEAD
jgi:hypothetical protein